METPALKKRPRALWIFGPIGAGKSTLLSRLPLAGFELISTDRELEAELRRRGWPAAVARYDPAQIAEFEALRTAVNRRTWDRVPGWRRTARDLAFETTGNKPDLFHAELQLQREHGYEILGCALAIPLAECLNRNAARQRHLPPDVVTQTVVTFERSWHEGVYQRLFAGARLLSFHHAQEAVAPVTEWLISPRSAQ